MKFTIVGATGFIGSHLLAHLQSLGASCYTPGRGESEIFGRELGNVIYCAGLTADFRERPFDSVAAHISYLNEILRSARFDSLLYLSSTRVYAGAAGTAEDEPLNVSPLDPDQLYGLTKLAGESICFAARREQVRVVRLSNVYGFDPKSANFLSSLMRDALHERKVVLDTTLDSAKDYISIDDVAQLLPQIASRGRERIYNVATGINVANAEIVRLLEHATGCRFEVSAMARRVEFPVIDIRRLQDEFKFAPRKLADALPAVIEKFKGAVVA